MTLAPKKRGRGAKREAYHHGDLRRSLMDEALKLMRRTGPEGLSLRELSRRLGVTYGAPHHHFPEKDDLFAAIAEAAFAELMLRVQERVLQVGELATLERLKIVGRTYLEFAHGERVRYQVMFLPQLRDRQRFKSLHATGGRALTLLAAAFEDLGLSREAARVQAVTYWATLHGFASLAIEGLLEETGAALIGLGEAVVDAALNLSRAAR